ncbi:hypothetical protein ACFVQ4_32750 [Streptomyces laurentii]
MLGQIRPCLDEVRVSFQRYTPARPARRYGYGPAGWNAKDPLP